MNPPFASVCWRPRVQLTGPRLWVTALLVATAACGTSGSSASSGASGASGSGSASGSNGSSGAASGSSGAGAPSSCAPGGPGMTNCGASHESCCTSPMVTGGTYYRTYDLTDAGTPLSPGDGGPVGEADPATVSNFRLDKYLVTVGRFRQFVNAVLPPDGGAGWLPAAATGKHAHLNGGKGLLNVGGDGGVAYEPGWVAADDSQLAPTTANLSCDPNYATWTGAPGSNENLPIDCVNWWESYAFCIWDGGFLPSEAEWEYAAAGGSQQREYPWGSTDPGMGSQYAIYGCFFDATGSCTSTMNIAPVGTTTLGAGLWGQLDLAGEFWEWNLDWAAPYVDPCVDCANVTVASFRGLRGGDFTIDPSEMYSSFRSNVAYPKARSNYNGLRCARAP